ncbi:MAG: hypothetical protein ABIJ40_03590 [Bacteroidota bacterium]
MASKYRKITISVSSDELEALEDILVVDFEWDTEREEKMRGKAYWIWLRLVKQWDKEE